MDEGVTHRQTICPHLMPTSPPAAPKTVIFPPRSGAHDSHRPREYDISYRLWGCPNSFVNRQTVCVRTVGWRLNLPTFLNRRASRDENLARHFPPPYQVASAVGAAKTLCRVCSGDNDHRQRSDMLPTALQCPACRHPRSARPHQAVQCCSSVVGLPWCRRSTASDPPPEPIYAPCTRGSPLVAPALLLLKMFLTFWSLRVSSRPFRTGVFANASA